MSNHDPNPTQAQAVGDNSEAARSRGFSVPILEMEVPGFADHQGALETLLVERRIAQGSARSSQGGWRTTTELHHSNDPEVQWLMSRILKISELRLQGAGELEPTESLSFVECWASVNDAGDWNSLHSHNGCEWAGVFYVAVQPNPPTTSGGQVYFVDPLGPQHGYRAAVKVEPQQGQMLLFPWYLVHMVAPHFSEHPRVSVTFNLARN